MGRFWRSRPRSGAPGLPGCAAVDGETLHGASSGAGGDSPAMTAGLWRCCGGASSREAKTRPPEAKILFGGQLQVDKVSALAAPWRTSAVVRKRPVPDPHRPEGKVHTARLFAQGQRPPGAGPGGNHQPAVGGRIRSTAGDQTRHDFGSSRWRNRWKQRSRACQSGHSCLPPGFLPDRPGCCVPSGR